VTDAEAIELLRFEVDYAWRGRPEFKSVARTSNGGWFPLDRRASRLRTAKDRRREIMALCKALRALHEKVWEQECRRLRRKLRENAR
jgi:hypothetical protein